MQLTLRRYLLGEYSHSFCILNMTKAHNQTTTTYPRSELLQELVRIGKDKNSSAGDEARQTVEEYNWIDESIDEVGGEDARELTDAGGQVTGVTLHERRLAAVLRKRYFLINQTATTIFQLVYIVALELKVFTQITSRFRRLL